MTKRDDTGPEEPRVIQPKKANKPTAAESNKSSKKSFTASTNKSVREYAPIKLNKAPPQSKSAGKQSQTVKVTPKASSLVKPQMKPQKTTMKQYSNQNKKSLTTTQTKTIKPKPKQAPSEKPEVDFFDPVKLQEKIEKMVEPESQKPPETVEELQAMNSQMKQEISKLKKELVVA